MLSRKILPFLVALKALQSLILSCPLLKEEEKKVTVGFVLQKSTPLIFLEIKRPQRLFLFFWSSKSACFSPLSVLMPQMSQCSSNSFVCLHREKFCQNLSKWKLSQYCKDEFSMVGVSGRTPERSISSKRGMTYG